MNKPESELLRVFISWSGERSKIVALALRDWLKRVTQGSYFFVSDRDIEAGSLWDEKIRAELEASSFGIAVLTTEALASKWLLFEAGALAKSVEVARVVPYLVGLTPGQVGEPLGRFQAVRSDSEGTLKLVRSINSQTSRALDEDKLTALFNAEWPALENELSEVPPPVEVAPRRRDEDVLDDILGIVRSIQQAVRPSPGRDVFLADQIAMRLAPRLGLRGGSAASIRDASEAKPEVKLGTLPQETIDLLNDLIERAKDEREKDGGNG